MKSARRSHLGSLEPGKDAELVIWNTHPFEVGAKPLYVLVDGAVVAGANMG